MTRGEIERAAKGAPWRLERSLALERWIDGFLAGAAGDLSAAVAAEAAAAADSLSHANALLSFDGAAALVKTVGMTAAQIEAWFNEARLGGRDVLEWAERAYGRGLKETLYPALSQCGVEGKGIAETVKVTLRAALDAGFEITRRDAVTLARTYIQTANVEARKAVYDANLEIVYGYEWMSVLDNHVCLRCAALDGKSGSAGRRGRRSPSTPAAGAFCGRL